MLRSWKWNGVENNSKWCVSPFQAMKQSFSLSQESKEKRKNTEKALSTWTLSQRAIFIHVYQHLYNFLVLVSSVIYVVSRVVYLPYRMPHRTTITTPQHYCFLFLSRKPKSEVSLGSIQIIIIIIIIKITK